MHNIAYHDTFKSFDTFIRSRFVAQLTKLSLSFINYQTLTNNQKVEKKIKAKEKKMETLDKVTLLEIAKNLSDSELAKLCRTNRKMKEFCSADNTLLWKGRLLKYLGPYYAKFPSTRVSEEHAKKEFLNSKEKNVVEIMDKYRLKYGMNWRDYYLSTMKPLDEYFIGLLSIGDLNIDEREDLSYLLNIMINEKFNVYLEYLYDNLWEDNKREKVDQSVYRSLTPEEKRWVSPEVMVSYILMGVITDEDLINEILNNKRIKYEVIDVVSNTEPVTPQGARIIQQFLRSEVEKYISGKDSIIKNENQSGWFREGARELDYKY